MAFEPKISSAELAVLLLETIGANLDGQRRSKAYKRVSLQGVEMFEEILRVLSERGLLQFAVQVQQVRER